MDSKQWKAIKLSRSGPPISHLFFADDLILFGEARNSQAYVMKNILKAFCSISGQKVNVAKSKLLVSKNTPSSLARCISQQVEIPLTQDLGVYLGMPLLHGRATKRTYGFLVDKVRKRLSGWKSRLLSKAAKSILIQSVSSTIPVYAMHTTRVPQG